MDIIAESLDLLVAKVLPLRCQVLSLLLVYFQGRLLLQQLAGVCFLLDNPTENQPSHIWAPDWFGPTFFNFPMFRCTSLIFVPIRLTSYLARIERC